MGIWWMTGRTSTWHYQVRWPNHFSYTRYTVTRLHPPRYLRWVKIKKRMVAALKQKPWHCEHVQSNWLQHQTLQHETKPPSFQHQVSLSSTMKARNSFSLYKLWMVNDSAKDGNVDDSDLLDYFPWNFYWSGNDLKVVVVVLRELQWRPV